MNQEGSKPAKRPTKPVFSLVFTSHNLALIFVCAPWALYLFGGHRLVAQPHLHRKKSYASLIVQFGEAKNATLGGSHACVCIFISLFCWTFISIVVSNVSPLGLSFILTCYTVQRLNQIIIKDQSLLHFVMILHWRVYSCQSLTHV